MARTTIKALVATTPRHLITQDGVAITSFRACETVEPGVNNWFTILAFNGIAIYANSSINKGDRIVVSGEIKLRDWDNGESTGTSVEINADTLGHDLEYGTSVFTRQYGTAEDTTTTTPHSCTCDRCGA